MLQNHRLTYHMHHTPRSPRPRHTYPGGYCFFPADLFQVFSLQHSPSPQCQLLQGGQGPRLLCYPASRVRARGWHTASSPRLLVESTNRTTPPTHTGTPELSHTPPHAHCRVVVPPHSPASSEERPGPHPRSQWSSPRAVVRTHPLRPASPSGLHPSLAHLPAMPGVLKATHGPFEATREQGGAPVTNRPVRGFYELAGCKLPLLTPFPAFLLTWGVVFPHPLLTLTVLPGLISATQI